jgi:AbiJ N-terminal domain 4
MEGGELSEDSDQILFDLFYRDRYRSGILRHMPTFSERHGLRSARPIQYRDELPQPHRIALFNLLRLAFVEVESRNGVLKRAGVPWSDSSLWDTIGRRFNRYGTETLPFPNARFEVEKDENYQETTRAKGFFIACPWNWLYDIVEDVAEQVQSFENHNKHWSNPEKALSSVMFRRVINDFFTYEGVGWKMDDSGSVVVRRDETFDNTMNTAIAALRLDDKPTAAEHLRFALEALSARPKPNTSGAVSHATSAVECVLGEITGATTSLGKYLDRNHGVFHPALKRGIDGIYGYASDAGARHGKEGVEPARSEADFVVATCAAVCTLLVEKGSK